MKRPSLLLAAWLLLGSCALAQTPTSTAKKDPRPLKDRLWFGGGIGLSFGTVTSISVEPVLC